MILVPIPIKDPVPILTFPPVFTPGPVLEKSLKMNRDCFDRCLKKIIYLEDKIEIIEGVLDFKIVNTILLNTCKNHQKKIDSIELNEYKNMKYGY